MLEKQSKNPQNQGKIEEPKRQYTNELGKKKSFMLNLVWNLVLELRSSVSFHSTFLLSFNRCKIQWKLLFFNSFLNSFLYYNFYPFPNHSFPYVKFGNTTAILDQNNVTMHQHGKKPIRMLLYQNKSCWPPSFSSPSYFWLAMLSFSVESFIWVSMPDYRIEFNYLLFCLLRDRNVFFL